jgi:competence protein ComFC
MKNSPSVCSTCSKQFESLEGGCHFCCKAGEAAICKDCQYWASLGQELQHYALYHYNDSLQDYFSKYKFLGDYRLRQVFRGEIKTALKRMRPAVFVPIPISEKRLQKRGFNQVEGLLAAAGISYYPLLNKSVDEKAQSSKGRYERLRLGKIFQINPEISLDFSSRIVLVDDIYTTGATIHSAVATLKEAGYLSVTSFSLAR